MFVLNTFLISVGLVLAFAVIAWGVSLCKRDVSIVDSLWSLMFLLAMLGYIASTPQTGPRMILVLVLVAVWSVRLSGYITWRNWGEGEDFRYREIRANNQPNFALNSIYIVFGLQAILASVISLPLLAAVTGQTPIGILDYLGTALWCVGLIFEAGGDFQLARFRASSENKGRVLDTGLWRYTRHPNYFGDFCIWWGFFLIALSAGGWWSIVAPLLMSFLLLKVSGVSLLEQDIVDRRPEYARYIEHTNAFFPGPRKRSSTAPKIETVKQ